VRVSVKTSLGVAIGGFIACKVPDDQSLVATGRKEHVWAAIDELVFLVDIFRQYFYVLFH
jgi:hypothetical protein